MLLGFALRVYRLSDQSIWMDEYLFIGLLPAESLKMHFLLARILAPELCISPIYFILQYIWGHLLCISIPVLRLLPISICILGIPVVYKLGEYVSGRFVGIVAALMLAISPQHIWYSQELRPYAPMTILVLFSCYALLKAVRENTFGWWILNIIANGLTLWIYALGGLIFLVQGLFLLVISRRSVKTLLSWTLFQLCVILPWLLRVLQIRFAHTFYLEPSLTETINALFLDDIISHHHDIMPAWKNNALESLPYVQQLIIPFRVFFDWTMVLVLGFCALYGLGKTVQLLWLRYSFSDSKNETSLESFGMLSLLILVPGLTLASLEFIFKRPFVGSMYIMYGDVCLYIFLGIILSRIVSSRLRHLALLGVVVLYVYQLILLLPGNTRTDYRHCAMDINQEAKSEDIVMCFQWLAPEDCLGYYLKEVLSDVKRITTLQGACDFAYESFALLPKGKRVEHTVWFAVPMYIFGFVEQDSKARSDFYDGLQARGLDWQETRYPGHWDVTLFKITLKNATLPMPPFPDVLMPFHYSEKLLAKDLHLSFVSEEQQRKNFSILRRHLFSWPPVGSFVPLMDSLDLLAAGHPKLSLNMASYVLAKHPKFSIAYFVAGLAHISLNEADKAKPFFETAFRLQPELGLLTKDYVAALYNDDIETAIGIVERLSQQCFIYFLPAMHTAAKFKGKTSTPDVLAAPPE